MDTRTTGTGTDFHNGTGYFVKFGTTSIPVPDLGKFGTTSIPVPYTSLSSVRYPYPCREYRYRTEHTYCIATCIASSRVVALSGLLDVDFCHAVARYFHVRLLSGALWPPYQKQ